MSKAKVHKVVLFAVDHDDLGANGVKSVLEGQRYPNRCLMPQVFSTETREVDWNDEHPLNRADTQHQVFEQMFELDTKLLARTEGWRAGVAACIRHVKALQGTMGFAYEAALKDVIDRLEPTMDFRASQPKPDGV